MAGNNPFLTGEHEHEHHWEGAARAAPPRNDHRRTTSASSTTFARLMTSVADKRSAPKDRSITSQHVPSDMELEPKTQLSFYQRHFTKPIDKNPEKFHLSTNRRFSVLSLGFLVAVALTLVILFGVIAAAVAVTIDKRNHAHVRSSYGSPGDNIPGLGNASASDPGNIPIRTAIFGNFPDPTLYYDNGQWLAFGTNDAAGILNQPNNVTEQHYGESNVQLATSLDFVNWTLQLAAQDPLPFAGAWAQHGMTIKKPSVPRANVWAPSVAKRADGKYVLFYSATAANVTNPKPKHPPVHCIGVSVSQTASAAGPYTPINQTLACPVDQGGAIDPAAFVDKDGTFYAAYKVDGNNIGNGGVCGNTNKPIIATPILLQKMLADGTTPDGSPVQILDRTDEDGPLIEAPQIVRSHEGIYFLFFSSGCTRQPTYNVKYATANSVAGPYTRARYPFLQTGDWGLLAPGSVGVHEDGEGGFNMAFHARVVAPQGKIRALLTTKLAFSGTSVRMVRNNSTAELAHAWSGPLNS